MKKHENKFIEWVRQLQPDALEFNPSSVQQLTQLLFAPYYTKRNKTLEEKLIKRNVKKTDSIDQEENKLNIVLINGVEHIEILPPERKFKVENIFVNYYNIEYNQRRTNIG